MKHPVFYTLLLGALVLLSALPNKALAQVFYSDWKSAHAWPSEVASANTADPDQDGLTNLVEYAFGGNPLLGGNNDHPLLPAMVKDSLGNTAFRFSRNDAFADIAYLAETSTDLKNWTLIASALIEVSAAEGTWKNCLVRTDPLEKARFYRVRVTGGDSTFLDSDGDGIPDYYERILGSDPNNRADADTDPEDTGYTYRERYEEIRNGRPDPAQPKGALEDDDAVNLRFHTPSL